MSTLGERIKSIRQENNMTQKQFSERLTVTQSYLSRIELNREKPTPMLLKLIALDYNINLNWIETGVDTKEINSNDFWDRTYKDNFKDDTLKIALELIDNLRLTDDSVIYRDFGYILDYLNTFLNRYNKGFSSIIFQEVANILSSLNEVISNLDNCKDKNKIPKITSVLISDMYLTVDVLVELYKSRLSERDK